jgi:hypothetical protein
MTLKLRMSGGFKEWKFLFENENGKWPHTRRTGKWVDKKELQLRRAGFKKANRKILGYDRAQRW